MTPDMETAFLQSLPPAIDEIRTETLSLTEPFVEIVRRFAHRHGTVALMSGGTLDCARYDLLGIDPWLTVTGKGQRVTLRHAAVEKNFEIDPFDALDRLLYQYALNAPSVDIPIAAGLLGYLSYDLKDRLEVLPRTSVDDLNLPDLFMVLPRILLIHDRILNKTTLACPQFRGMPTAETTQRMDAFKQAVSAPLEADSSLVLPMAEGRLASPFTRSAYMDAVETIRNYIVEGHVYQVNMSQRFETAFSGDAFELYAGMYRDNPAPFFAYINAGDHRILSTSPERFIRLDGKKVETRPIKGTRPRGNTPEADEQLKNDLKASPKDDAELSMIVDLLRNDIGKVCAAGSVKVSAHKRLEAYQNVYHLVSIVDGILDDDKTAIDLLRATFPGGSITGCPKIRAMEIIDELEPVRRHIYTGSIGYVSFHETMDLSIAIRTATVTRGKVYFSVGGGIVYDSDPADEFEETLHKGKTLMRSIQQDDRQQEGNVKNIVWHNGGFKPAEAATVSCDDEGFLFGCGIFESIRVECSEPVLLDAHLERFHRAYRAFFKGPVPEVSWREIIQHLVEKNQLTDATAKCKILVAAGKPGEDAPGTLLVTVSPYRHRLEGKSQDGLRLAVFPHRRHSFLSDHKTLNYMFYKVAGQYAASQNADEAVIRNGDGTVSETNTANLFCVVSDQIICPASPHALPGTMLQAVVEALEKRHRTVVTKPLTVEQLQSAENVFVTNALIGIVPVMSIDGKPVKTDHRFCRELNEAVLGRSPYLIPSDREREG